MWQPAVYMLTNQTRSVVYTGVTSALESRLQKHRLKTDPDAFTAKYNCTELVHVEYYQTMMEAITREKEIKGWRWDKKRALIEEHNREWRNLWPWR
jgi:putative endonuclease